MLACKTRSSTSHVGVKLLLACALAWAVVACPCPCSAQGKRTPDKPYKEGQGLLKAGKYCEAIKAFADAIASNRGQSEGTPTARVGETGGIMDWTPHFLLAHAAYKCASSTAGAADSARLFSEYLRDYPKLVASQGAAPPAVAYYLRGCALQAAGSADYRQALLDAKARVQQSGTGIELLDAQGIAADDLPDLKDKGKVKDWVIQDINRRIGGPPHIRPPLDGNPRLYLPCLHFSDRGAQLSIDLRVTSWDTNGNNVEPKVIFDGQDGSITAMGEEWIASYLLSFPYLEPRTIKVTATNGKASPDYTITVVPAQMPPPLFNAVRR